MIDYLVAFAFGILDDMDAGSTATHHTTLQLGALDSLLASMFSYFRRSHRNALNTTNLRSRDREYKYIKK
jgi:hypothetical protein